MSYISWEVLAMSSFLSYSSLQNMTNSNRGLYGKEKLLQEELKKANMDIAVIPETKKKLKGLQELEDYILLYSGVPVNKRAAAGTAIMNKVKFKKRIHSYMFVNERILQLRYKLQRGYLTLLAVYAPEEEKTEKKKQKNSMKLSKIG